MTADQNSFGAKASLSVGDSALDYYRLDAVDGSDKLPFSLKILLENLLRTEDGANVTEPSRSAPSPAGTRPPSPTPRSSSPRRAS